jgi:YHS domain-containing protein
MKVDPVCGMNVKKRDAKFKSLYKGKGYYFCAQSCQYQFDQDPERFIK